MDIALPQKFPFILDRNLAKANCTENQVCTSCDIVVLDIAIKDKIKRTTPIEQILKKSHDILKTFERRVHGCSTVKQVGITHAFPKQPK